MSNHIYSAHQNKTGLIWVEGAGTHENVQSLRDALKDILEEDTKQVVIELEHCYHLDSTFMGVMAKESRLFKQTGFEAFYISRPQEPVLNEMETLGLHHLMRMEDYPSEEMSSLKKEVVGEISKDGKTVVMHEAHQTLSEMSDSNHTRFKDVLHHLAKKLGL
jgi:anti-anti-sigma factor